MATGCGSCTWLLILYAAEHVEVQRTHTLKRKSFLAASCLRALVAATFGSYAVVRLDMCLRVHVTICICTVSGPWVFVACPGSWRPCSFGSGVQHVVREPSGSTWAIFIQHVAVLPAVLQHPCRGGLCHYPCMGGGLLCSCWAVWLHTGQGEKGGTGSGVWNRIVGMEQLLSLKRA